jgi:glutamine cyclotransferase
MDMSMSRLLRMALMAAWATGLAACQPASGSSRTREGAGEAERGGALATGEVAGDDGATSGFQIIARYPHDSAAYTQGLLWTDGVLYESTGRYGESDLRRVDLRTGRVLAQTDLPANRFGEGLALLGRRLYQLTWESKVGYVYDASTLVQVDSFAYAGEGWGLTTDGTSLIMSDGSDSLRVLSPRTLATERVVRVRHNGSALTKLNELEYVDGEIFANVYESDWVARIDAATGEVRELIDFSGLFPKDQRSPWVEVMNGIALGPSPAGGAARRELLLTGKLWPVLFHVRLR